MCAQYCVHCPHICVSILKHTWLICKHIHKEREKVFDVTDSNKSEHMNAAAMGVQQILIFGIYEDASQIFDRNRVHSNQNFSTSIKFNDLKNVLSSKFERNILDFAVFHEFFSRFSLKLDDYRQFSTFFRQWDVENSKTESSKIQDTWIKGRKLSPLCVRSWLSMCYSNPVQNHLNKSFTWKCNALDIFLFQIIPFGFYIRFLLRILLCLYEWNEWRNACHRITECSRKLNFPSSFDKETILHSKIRKMKQTFKMPSYWLCILCNRDSQKETNRNRF